MKIEIPLSLSHSLVRSVVDTLRQTWTLHFVQVSTFTARKTALPMNEKSSVLFTLAEERLSLKTV